MRAPYVSLFTASWRYARGLRRRMAIIYLLFVIVNLVSALRPAVYGWLIDHLQRDPAQIGRTVWLYAGMWMLISVGVWIILGPCRVAERKLAFDVGMNFLRERYHAVLQLPLEWHNGRHSGNTINRIRKGYEALKNFLSDGFESLFLPVNMLISLVAMFVFSPLFGALGLAMACLTVWLIVRTDGRLAAIRHEVNEREHSLVANLFDTLSKVVTVIALRLEKRMEGALASRAEAILPAFRRWATLNEWKWFAAYSLAAMTYVVIVIAFIYKTWIPGQVFHVGSLVALIGYVEQFTNNFHYTTWQYSQLIQYDTDIEGARIAETDTEVRHRTARGAALPRQWRRCRISQLRYAYRDGARAAVDNVLLEIERGKRIAVVGQSGAGKSTLLSLIRGLYKPSPQVVVDVDGRVCCLEAVGETTTLIPQEPEIFENTVVYNMTLGLPFAEEEIRRVCEVAQFAEIARNLPQGVASHIQEKGINLSGGQKQRLALARGILAARNSDIVLLDEPTSSVDSRTEAGIYRCLMEEFRDKAVIATVHRLHLLAYFDTVYVMHDGQIVASGSVEQLLLSSTHFQGLWKQHSPMMSTEPGLS